MCSQQPTIVKNLDKKIWLEKHPFFFSDLRRIYLTGIFVSGSDGGGGALGYHPREKIHLITHRIYL